MRDPVEDPVAADQRGEDREDAAVPAGREAVDRAEHDAPDDQHHERVRPGIADEVERRERGVAGIDPHLLDAERDEHRPQDVRDLRGGEQHGEVHARRRAFGGEAECEVADEHASGRYPLKGYSPQRRGHYDGSIMRLHDYLDRIGGANPAGRAQSPAADAPGPDLETLRRLHAAHRETFLFENVTIQTGGRISLALDDLERKFIDERRGGYCFEHNTLFASALREIGFAPVTMLGRVRRGPPERWCRTHMVLRMPIAGETWMA